MGREWYGGGVREYDAPPSPTCKYLDDDAGLEWYRDHNFQREHVRRQNEDGQVSVRRQKEDDR